MFEDGLFIVIVSLISALVAEGINWLLIYRTDDYKKLKKYIDSLSKKLEKKKETVATIDKQKSKDKKVNIMDEQLKVKNREMGMVKMKSTFFVMLTLFGVFQLLSNQFDGRPVAKLPFTPFPLIRGFTHRNLPGNDFTDCSMLFMYILCSFSIRSNVQRFFGFSPPKGGSEFFPTPSEKTW